MKIWTYLLTRIIPAVSLIFSGLHVIPYAKVAIFHTIGCDKMSVCPHILKSSTELLDVKKTMLQEMWRGRRMRGKEVLLYNYGGEQ